VPAAVVVASWIVTVRPEMREAARLALGGIPGARLGDHADPLIVTTECPEEDFAALHDSLARAPGVRTVSMVVAYKDGDPESGS
jgi:nitrate reductase NapAB chaperone NapD